MSVNFDEIIDRRNSHSAKWDAMETVYGVSSEDGLAMWVADTDFKPPSAVNDAVADLAKHGVHGYYANDASYRNAIKSWMDRRHGWQIKPEWIYPAHGLGAAIALCLQSLTKPDDGVIVFSPVYHAFAKYINANGRRLVESELRNVNGRYELDLDRLQAALTGDETMMIFCSPHNPGGRVWSRDELRAVAAFCQKNNILLVSDEIHHDLVFAPNKHISMPLAAPEIDDRLIMLVAPSKTFNIAGGMSGCVVISDPVLQEKYAKASVAAGVHGNRYGMIMAETAYDNGDEYVADLLKYLAENHRIFDEGVNKIPGVRSMKLESTYLAWVDFSDTGMPMNDVKSRVETQAKIAANYGETFGKGGEHFLRFNLGCRREMVIDAVDRLQKAFKDLQ
ncbi:MAG: pyridoxal phosphate-dependent aminotransferase [Rhodobacteraceae bacterium]|nr:pyridoxal phosphate-dependent aminotransferase [Paracoccaceae bacterium]